MPDREDVMTWNDTISHYWDQLLHGQTVLALPAMAETVNFLDTLRLQSAPKAPVTAYWPGSTSMWRVDLPRSRFGRWEQLREGNHCPSIPSPDVIGNGHGWRRWRQRSP